MIFYHRLFGHDQVDLPLGGERQRALLENLRRPIPGAVFHGNDHLAGSGDQVHRSAHTGQLSPGIVQLARLPF